MVVGSKHEFDLGGDIASVRAALDTAETALGEALEKLRPALGNVALYRGFMSDDNRQKYVGLVDQYTKILELGDLSMAGLIRALGIPLDGLEQQDGELAAVPDPSQTALSPAAPTSRLGLPSVKSAIGAGTGKSNGAARKTAPTKEDIPKLDVSKAIPRPGHDYRSGLVRPLCMPDTPLNGRTLLAVDDRFVAIGGVRVVIAGTSETVAMNALLAASYIDNGFFPRSALAELFGSSNFVIPTFGTTLRNLQTKFKAIIKTKGDLDLYETSGTGAGQHYRLNPLLVPVSTADLPTFEEPEEAPKG